MSDETSTSRRLRAWLAVVIVMALGVIAAVPLFVYPSVDAVGEVRAGGAVDAVVVLGGGPGDRIGTALELLPLLPEPPAELVLSIPYGAPLVGCGDVPGLPRVTARCFVPAPFTTSGEAASIIELATELGWDRIVVVTSDFHVTRSRALVRRCVEVAASDLEVSWVVARTEALSTHGLFAIVTEVPSLLGTPWDHEPTCTAPDLADASEVG